MYILCILTRVWHNSGKTDKQYCIRMANTLHLELPHSPTIVLYQSDLTAHGMWPNSQTIWVGWHEWIRYKSFQGSAIKVELAVAMFGFKSNTSTFVYTCIQCIQHNVIHAAMLYGQEDTSCSWCKSRVRVVWYTCLLYRVGHACSVQFTEVALSRLKGADTTGIHARESSCTAEWLSCEMLA